MLQSANRKRLKILLKSGNRYDIYDMTDRRYWQNMLPDMLLGVIFFTVFCLIAMGIGYSYAQYIIYTTMGS